MLNAFVSKCELIKPSHKIVPIINMVFIDQYQNTGINNIFLNKLFFMFDVIFINIYTYIFLINYNYNNIRYNISLHTYNYSFFELPFIDRKIMEFHF